MNGQLPLGVTLEDHARFDTYFAGPNEAAVAHLRAFPGRKFKASWIWGSAGCGKTHLLQAVCAAADERGVEAAYFPLAAAAGLRPQMLEGWDALQLACLDDIDAVAGETGWEHAMFHLFNAVTDRGGAVLAASTTGPDGTDFLLPDLRSRLGWGPVYRISPLSDSDRLAALQLRARQRGLFLANEVGEWLLRRVPRDMAYLYRLLDTLDRASLAAQRRLTIPFVREFLASGGVAGGSQNSQPVD